MKNHACFVHSGRPDLAVGHIIFISETELEANVVADSTELYVTCHTDEVVKHQRQRLRLGSYIAWIIGSKTAKIHVCTCKWTTADIDKARERADELWTKIQEL